MADDGLSAGAVARRLGVAVTTLRTWHQRYGLGPSRHTPGQHRRYTPDDMARLDMMRRLTAQGVAPAEAAAWARRIDVATGLVPENQPAMAPAGPVHNPAPRATAHAGPPRNHRDGGGNSIPVGRAGPAARGLARAAVRLDTVAMREILRTVVHNQGVIAAWDTVIAPVLVGVGRRHATTQRFIDVEHLLSRSITETFAIAGRHTDQRVPRVLLSCADDEQHTLPLEALAAALAENDIPSRLLGARVPARALKDAVARTGPVAVVVWSHGPATANANQLTQLLTGSWRPVLVAAAGPGWNHDDLPPEVPHLANLTDAVRHIRGAIPPAR
ncbi:MerR family transcriptional regulator [Spirilliplanes yamanashiensis]|uniref:MerR family transcriptional regulator n=1 Tax=Spirilliplanes yamanashiensis TaxID=42233 RepID=UPI00194F9D96|nr:MerR family transcriptional regulator [Spirilliplanes yamanashiensis]MDP9815180.1 transposase-like protein [Spirilliplanes yamanashiensis]